MKRSLRQNGKSMVGQGRKIMFFALPSLIAAIGVHISWPQIAALPTSLSFLRPVGYVLFVVGLIFSGIARVQLRKGFSQGKLVTSGVYSIVRNPIYSSMTFFILPAIALTTLTWVYLVVSIFVYTGVVIFVGKEEEQLAKAFGQEYEDYQARVDRLIPFKKPRNHKAR